MSPILQAILAALIGGALSSAAAVSVDSGDLKGSLLKIGTVAATGAALAVAHLFVPSPNRPKL